MSGHNYVDGQVYKLTEEWMIFQVDEDGVVDEDYTEEEVEIIVEKFGVTEDPIVFNPIIIPIGTEFLKLPDSEECENETEDCWKELQFKLADTEIVVKLNLVCPYTGHMLSEMLA